MTGPCSGLPLHGSGLGGRCFAFPSLAMCFVISTALWNLKLSLKTFSLLFLWLLRKHTLSCGGAGHLGGCSRYYHPHSTYIEPRLDSSKTGFRLKGSRGVHLLIVVRVLSPRTTVGVSLKRSS